ncbi:uncharacterized protein LOC103510623 [Diaphorina citri]|uniref:Uncharacterized protein LOC103510623 n=1 Tax=Diaphorina citri TaxID=121845 RepID=A0A1S4ED38_DIACI|nr:uncharacterized protein LOC103510623 [Diaphorina citri]
MVESLADIRDVQVVLDFPLCVSAQFTSVGSGFFRSHYGTRIRFDHPIHIKSITTSENNVILKLTHSGCSNVYYYAKVQGGDEIKTCIPEPEYYMEHDFDQVSNQDPMPSPAATPSKPSNTEEPSSPVQGETKVVNKEEDRENQGQRESKKMDIPKSKSTSSLCDNGVSCIVVGIKSTVLNNPSSSGIEPRPHAFSGCNS